MNGNEVDLGRSHLPTHIRPQPSDYGFPLFSCSPLLLLYFGRMKRYHTPSSPVSTTTQDRAGGRGKLWLNRDHSPVGVGFLEFTSKVKQIR